MTTFIILPTIENIHQAAMACREGKATVDDIVVTRRKSLPEKIMKARHEGTSSKIFIFAPFDLNEDLRNSLKTLSYQDAQVDWYGDQDIELQTQIEKVSNTRTHIGRIDLTKQKDVRDYLQFKKTLTFLGDEKSKFAPFHIKEAIENISANPNSIPEKDQASVKMFSRIDYPAIEGRSEKINDLKKAIHRVAGASLNKVLLFGETGTGKEAAAYFLHFLDPMRKKEIFGSVNCAMLQEDFLISKLFGHVKGAYTGATEERAGLVSELNKGTLFLDELPDMPPRVQTMLLRFLESGTYSKLGSNEEIESDVKIISGGQKSLFQERIRANKFRKDLYYRLAGKTITLPSLAEIPEDLYNLIVHLAYKIESNYSIRDETISYFNDRMEDLQAHSWPGNVRELANYVTRRLKLGKEEHIDLQEFKFIGEQNTTPKSDVLKPSLDKAISYNDISPTAPLETSHIDQARDVYKNYINHIYTSLKRRDLSQTNISKILGISVNTLKDNLQ